MPPQRHLFFKSPLSHSWSLQLGGTISPRLELMFWFMQEWTVCQTVSFARCSHRIPRKSLWFSWSIWHPPPSSNSILLLAVDFLAFFFNKVFKTIATIKSVRPEKMTNWFYIHLFLLQDEDCSFSSMQLNPKYMQCVKNKTASFQKQCFCFFYALSLQLLSFLSPNLFSLASFFVSL